MTPPDEVAYWNDPAVAADLHAGSTGTSEFARMVDRRLRRRSRLVELGCGPGDDAAFMAEQGHHVIAIDVSMPLIELASQRFDNVDNVEFRQADITKPLQVGGNGYDCVYSRLSLHYFDDETTTRIFSEVFWVLRSGGQFHFISKSVDDPLYGKGIEIGRDMYELDGHVRHFFRADETFDLMEDTGFLDVDIMSGTDKFYGWPSAYILVSGRKP